MAEKSGVSGRGRALVLVIFGREKEKELVWRWRRKKERKKNAREKGCFLRGFAFWRLPGESFGGEKQAEKTGHLLEKEEDIESKSSSCRKKKSYLERRESKEKTRVAAGEIGVSFMFTLIHMPLYLFRVLDCFALLVLLISESFLYSIVVDFSVILVVWLEIIGALFLIYSISLF